MQTAFYVLKPEYTPTGRLPSSTGVSATTFNVSFTPIHKLVAGDAHAALAEAKATGFRAPVIGRCKVQKLN